MEIEAAVNENAPLETPEDFSDGYILGLDIGSNSVGWAMVNLGEGETLKGLKTGVRIFAGGTENTKSGEKSRAVDRRLARQSRRQLERRIRRRRKVARILHEHGLLPPEPQPEWNRLDRSPYLLREKALTGKLTPHEIGRALYHLVKHRGFKSSRKEEAGKDEKELGVVKEGIGKLAEVIQETGAPTLGAYLARIDPTRERIRNRYLGRPMILEEFDAIWNAQRPHHPGMLTDDLYNRLKEAAFFQRKLKSQKGRIGKCPLTEEQRCPKESWFAHQIRVLQEIANLRIVGNDGVSRPLTDAQREAILGEAMTHDEVKLQPLRKRWVRKKLMAEGETFNLEEGEREKISGNMVEVGLFKAFKDRWEREADDLRYRMWEDFINMEDEEFDAIAGEKWKIGEEEIKAMAKIRAGTGYARYSLTAIQRLLPHLENADDLYTAITKEFPDHAQLGEACDQLPALTPDGVVNPVVTRAVSETRKLVNAITRRWGKPREIVVELARETRGSIEERQRRNKDMRANEKEREGIKKVLQDQHGIDANNDNITRYRLWIEAGGPASAVCPYTGKTIGFHDLFGSHPRFDIEHILPYSKSFDDGYVNLTLCESEENRKRKGNRTPWEVYGETPEFDRIIQRLEVMRGQLTDRNKRRLLMEKIRRFKMKELPDDFSTRQITDTSYAAREVCKILKQLDVDVRTAKGRMTSVLRGRWGLGDILPEPVPAGQIPRDPSGKKKRHDHRHHAVDAVVVALVNPARVHALSTKYRRHGEPRSLQLPWGTIRQDVTRSIDQIIVSHRPNHKLAGSMNEETNYGRIGGENSTDYVYRVPVRSLKGRSLDDIIDPAVRRVIHEALERFGVEPVKLTDEQLDEIRMPSRKGRGPVIRRVRVRKTIKSVVPVPVENPVRYLKTGSNHHLSLFRATDARGRVRIIPYVTTVFEAMQRKRRGEPIVTRIHPDYPDAEFLMWLMKDDMVRMKDAEDKIGIFKAVMFSGPPASKLDWVLERHNCAVVMLPRDRLRVTSLDPDSLPEKVNISFLGEVYPCND